MPTFRIHRMKDAARAQFRWAPHTGGLTEVKPKDFEQGGEAQGGSFYDVWNNLRGTPEELRVGDVLESDSGTLRICKYVGFEEARWLLPELKTGLEHIPPAAGAGPSLGPSPAGNQ
jgi:hypothetical protein